jgi:hypothetical protein
VCALNMLGRSAASLPPIELVREIPVDVSATAEGYVRLGERRIYLVATSPTFRRAQMALDRCGDTMAIRKIASVVIHEEVHLKQGAGEKSAYQAQLTTLTALGAGPMTPPYREVVLAMRHAMKLEKAKRPAGLLAATLP